MLTAPAEMMVVGNASLELLRNFAAIEDLPFRACQYCRLPFHTNGRAIASSRSDLTNPSMRCKILRWKTRACRDERTLFGLVTTGADFFSSRGMTWPVVHALDQKMHATTNMLVDARMSLFVIYPGLKVGHFVNFGGTSPITRFNRGGRRSRINSDNPFAQEFNFGVFVNETGGKLFYNRNDVDAEIGRSQLLGSEYYTLTYQPHGGNEDGSSSRFT